MHVIGDVHAGGIKRPRVSALLDDVAKLSKPVAHLQVGDVTEHGLPEEDVLALRWLGRLPSAHHTILGNHDVMHNKRTPADWAKVYGVGSPNYLIDLPFVRIIALAPGRDGPTGKGGTLSKTTLDWLDLRLKNAGRDCWIACHWPLRDTVLGDPRKVFTSRMDDFYARPDASIRGVLARHPNAKLWISGHTHSPLGTDGMVTRAKLPGGHSIVAINASAIVGVGKVREPTDPICSLYLSHFPGRIEVRWRDHGRRAWKTVHGKRVQTVKV